MADSLGRDSSSEVKKVETLPPETSLLIKDIRKNLEAAFEAHSKLVVGMNEWSINDFFFKKAGSNKVKQALLVMIGYPDHQLVKLRGNNKERSLKRVNNFLDNVATVLDDYALFSGGANNETNSVRNFAEQYRKRFPRPRRKISVTQTAAFLSALFSAVLLSYTVLNVFDPSGFIFVGLLSLAVFMIGLSAALAAAVLIGWELRLYFWYRKMLRQFDVVKNENATYRALRKLTRLMSQDLHKSF